MSAFYSFLRGFLYVPVKLVFPVKVIGRENIPLPSKVITVSNHLSGLDIALVAINVKGFRHIIAKKELTKSKVFAKLMDWAGAIPVDRGTADLSAVRKVMDALKNGEGITIFPEGTRNKTGENLQELKSGAALFALKGKASVVPIILLHKQRVFRRNYMYVGKPFSVETFAEGRIDSIAVENASRKIGEEMQRAKDYLEDYVSNNRARELKLEKKAAKKRFKNYEKQAAAGKAELEKFIEFNFK